MDVVPRAGEADGILLSADRNPNTAGAKLLGVAAETPGARLPEIIAGVNERRIRGLICLGEDAAENGADPRVLAELPCLVVTGLLPNATTDAATVVLPGSGFAEKRGSMINVKGRLQRLNRAISPPADVRDDWEILRDLILGLTGSNGLYMIEDVFRALAADTPALAGLSLSKIGDLGVEVAPPREQPPVPTSAGETKTGALPSP
jgi:NADH-quinone oxidoreductase subunit G